MLAAASCTQSLLRGLGVPDLDLKGPVDEKSMELIGRLLREMTACTVDMLRLRAQAKSSIHAEMTIIGPRAVNPLKAAWDVDVALRHLLAPERADLMSPVRAVTDAYDDLRAHDRGLAAGIQAALASLLARFSPSAFEERLRRRRARPFPAGEPQGAAMGALARDLRRPRRATRKRISGRCSSASSAARTRRRRWTTRPRSSRSGVPTPRATRLPRSVHRLARVAQDASSSCAAAPTCAPPC